MLRFSLILLTFLTLLPDAQGQGILSGLFGGRRRDRCPDCYPVSPDNSPDWNSPSVPHPETIAPETDLAEYEKIIPKEIRVRNRRGNCCWCALEDVFVAAGYSEVAGVTDQAIKEGWNGAGIHNVRSFLSKVHLLDQSKITENKDYSIFDHAKKEGLAVYIQIPNHAIAVVGLDDKHAYIVDNNPPLTVQRWTRREFDRKWEGVACCPLFRKHKPKPDSPTPAPVTPATPSVDLGPLTSKVDNLAANQKALVDAVDGLQKNIGGMTQSLTVIDQRLRAVESKSTPSPGVGPAVPLPVPPIPIKSRIIPESPPG